MIPLVAVVLGTVRSREMRRQTNELANDTSRGSGRGIGTSSNKVSRLVYKDSAQPS